MRRRMPFYLAALAIVGLFAGLSFADPEWPIELGIDVWNLGDLHDSIHQGQRLRRELDDRDADIVLRIAMKHAVISDLLRGRTELLDAAGEFRRIIGESPQTYSILRRVFPSASDEEALCRSVISFAELAMIDKPERWPQEGTHLQNQLDDALANGSVLLR